MNDALHPSFKEASEAWATRVRGDREQVAAFREEPERSDFYGPIAANFKADPRREGDPVLNILGGFVQSGETWMDIGAGGGRLGLGIALVARELIAVEPSEGMLAVLRESMTEYGVTNVRIVQSRWPMANAPRADVSFISGVGNDIEDFGAFIDAMEESTERLCVAVQPSRPPASFSYPFWPDVHGVERVPLPCLPELLAMLLARDRVFEVQLVPRPPMSFENFDHAHRMLRLQTWVKPGTDKDARLRAAIESRMTERDGRWALNWTPGRIGVVSWAPR